MLIQHHDYPEWEDSFRRKQEKVLMVRRLKMAAIVILIVAALCVLAGAIIYSAGHINEALAPLQGVGA